MLPDDQRRAGGAHGEGRGAGAEDQRRRPAQGARRAVQAVPRQAGRDGEVEGGCRARTHRLPRSLTHIAEEKSCPGRPAVTGCVACPFSRLWIQFHGTGLNCVFTTRSTQPQRS